MCVCTTAYFLIVIVEIFNNSLLRGFGSDRLLFFLFFKFCRSQKSTRTWFSKRWRPIWSPIRNPNKKCPKYKLFATGQSKGSSPYGRGLSYVISRKKTKTTDCLSRINIQALYRVLSQLGALLRPKQSLITFGFFLSIIRSNRSSQRFFGCEWTPWVI